MSDVKPKRTARDSGHSKTSPGEAEPTAPSPAIVPEAPAAAQAASALPEAVAEPAPEVVPAFTRPPADSVDNSWTVFVEAQTALARGFGAIAVEVNGMARSGVATTVDAAIALLGARTFSEAVEIHAGLAQRAVDAMIEGSAKLSEIGAAAMSEASRPILSQFGGAWSSVGSGLIPGAR
jgi:hypothetical protein